MKQHEQDETDSQAYAIMAALSIYNPPFTICVGPLSTALNLLEVCSHTVQKEVNRQRREEGENGKGTEEKEKLRPHICNNNTNNNKHCTDKTAVTQQTAVEINNRLKTTQESNFEK